MAFPESVWSLSAELGFEGLDLVQVGVVSDDGGKRFTAGTQQDFEDASALPELNDFLKTIGYGSLSPAATPSNLNDYTFRFHAVATGSILVLGGNKALASQTVTDNLTDVLAELNLDSEFTTFMNIISTPGTIIVDASTAISFSFLIGDQKISSAVGTPFSGLVASDKIEVIGSVSNDKTFTVSGVELGGARIRVTPNIVVESAGAEITIVKLP